MVACLKPEQRTDPAVRDTSILNLLRRYLHRHEDWKQAGEQFWTLCNKSDLGIRPELLEEFERACEDHTGDLLLPCTPQEILGYLMRDLSSSTSHSVMGRSSNPHTPAPREAGVGGAPPPGGSGETPDPEQQPVPDNKVCVGSRV